MKLTTDPSAMTASDSMLAATARAPRNPLAIVMSSGTLDALKWLALVLMVLDHTDKFILHGSVPVFSAMGRLCLPLFSFALMYSLAQPGAIESGVALRVARRCVLAGLVAMPFYVYLCGSIDALIGTIFPLNALFQFALSAVLVQCQAGSTVPGIRGTAHAAAAGTLFVLGGLVVEYWWFGLLLSLTTFAFCRAPSVLTLLGWCAALFALTVPNDSAWAVAALPLVWLAPLVNIQLPRVRQAFYLLYPLHFALLAAALFVIN